MCDHPVKPNDIDPSLNDLLHTFECISAALEMSNAESETAKHIAQHAARLIKTHLSRTADGYEPNTHPSPFSLASQDYLILAVSLRSPKAANQLRNLSRTFVTDPLNLVITLIQELDNRMKKGTATNAKKNA